MNETLNFLITHGYALLFAYLLVCHLGVFLPAVPLLLAAGAVAGLGRLDMAWALLAACAGTLFGDLVWFVIGRRGGHKVLSFLCRLSLDPDSCVLKTKGIFIRHGAPSLLFSKFLPGVSTVAPPLAGAARMGVFRFLLFDGLGILIWTGFYAGLGYYFSQQLELLAFQSLILGKWFGLFIAAGIAGYIFWKYLRRRRILRELAIARISPNDPAANHLK